MHFPNLKSFLTTTATVLVGSTILAAFLFAVASLTNTFLKGGF